MENYPAVNMFCVLLPFWQLTLTTVRDNYTSLKIWEWCLTEGIEENRINACLI